MFFNIDTVACTKLRCHALEIVQAGLDAVSPRSLFLEKVDFKGGVLTIDDISLPVNGRIFVVGAGKAAGLMAEAFERQVGVENIAAGIVNCTTTDYQTQKIKINKGSHPYPDEGGVQGVKQMLALKEQMQPEDIVVCLLSAGGSALLADPAGNITLEDEKWLMKQFFAYGIPTSEINIVRKHISNVKGGQLARYFEPHKIISIIISNIPREDESLIVSGPTIEPTTTYAQAYDILHKNNIDIPKSVEEFLKDKINNQESISKIKNSSRVVIGDTKTALDAMYEKAKQLGYDSHILAYDQEGVMSDVAIQRAKDICSGSYSRFNALLLGGQTTQVVPEDHGANSRNLAFVLTSLKHLQSLQKEWVMISIKTDGMDEFGVAGAIIDNTTPAIDIDYFLKGYDSYTYFESIGNCILKTSNTGTNVCDIQLYLIK